MNSRSLLRRKKPTIEDIRCAPKQISRKDGPFGGYEMFFFEGRWYYTHQYYGKSRAAYLLDLRQKATP